jgi:hypothetical protein
MCAVAARGVECRDRRRCAARLRHAIERPWSRDEKNHVVGVPTPLVVPVRPGYRQRRPSRGVDFLEATAGTEGDKTAVRRPERHQHVFRPCERLGQEGIQGRHPQQPATIWTGSDERQAPAIRREHETECGDLGRPVHTWRRQNQGAIDGGVRRGALEIENTPKDERRNQRGRASHHDYSQPRAFSWRCDGANNRLGGARVGR